MAEEDKDQKTEAPSGKRLSEARERGQLPLSRETSSWITFLAVLIVVTWLGAPAMSRISEALKVFLEMPHAISLDDVGMQSLLYDTLWKIGRATFAIFFVMAVAAIIGTVSQTGLFASFELLKPDISRILPSKGLSRIFSLSALVEFGKSFGKLVLLGGATFYLLYPITTQLESFAEVPLMSALMFLHQEAVHLVTVLLLIFGLIAMIDLFYQRYNFTKSLKMTKSEVKDEFKQSEGDPAIKGRLRQIRVEKARKRMMAKVPKADVIVTNPTHYAIAMQYDSAKMAAPIVVAKGINLIAERIKEIAIENKVPLVSNPPLARALYETVELDQAIPTEHYRAVAEVISYVYKLKKLKY